ncbi:biotin--[acetyl-CoA-carboxylase] ligase [Halorubrum luteum]
MDTRRALLDALTDGPVSGPELAAELGVSRAAVWKAVETLRDEGFAVKSTGDGYAPPTEPPYGAAGIEFGLNVPYTVEYHDALGSTNDRARELAASGESSVAVVADEQTGGRGRLEREWTAPSGGVWVSVLTSPAIPTSHAPVCTLAAAVATTDACREAGVDAGIKWPNDVLVGREARDAGRGDGEPRTNERGDQKLAGILTEMEGEADRVSWLVVGVGINANVDVGVLPDGATSLSAVRGEPVDRRRLLQRLLERYQELTTMPDRILPAWRERAETLGASVRVDTPDGEVCGTAVDIEFPGQLVVDTGDECVRVHAGDCEHLRPATE